jgi:DNA-binding response OmpR family regulator
MTSPTALIIEHDKKLAKIFSFALQRVNFTTEIIEDGQTALARLNDTTPALIVLDLHLPQVSGKTILRRIRNSQRLANTRVMLATADARMADSVRNEADLVLLKPISVNLLRHLAVQLQTLNNFVREPESG